MFTTRKSLKELKIYVYIGTASPVLNLRQRWVAPLLHFRRNSRARSDSEKLNTVEIDFRTRLSRWPFRGNSQLARANQDLHRLFGMAIRDAVLGETEQVAMRAFMEKWEGEHAMWQQYLAFAPTGW